MYTKGKGPSTICKYLMDNGYKTGAGKKIWRDQAVNKILKNEKYVGDLLQQKTVTLDYLSHKRVRNKELSPMHHKENSHEAIIDRETFELAQRIMADRSETKRGDNKDSTKYTKRYPLSSMVVCAHCGRNLKRRFWNFGTPAQKIMLQCGGYLEGKAHCTAKAQNNDAIERTALHVINELFMKNNDIMTHISKFINNNIKISQTESDLIGKRAAVASIEQEIEQLINLSLTTPNMPKELVNKKMIEITDRLDSAKLELLQIEKSLIQGHEAKSRIDTINHIIKENEQDLTFLTNELLAAFMQKVISVNQNEVVFCILTEKKYKDIDYRNNINYFLSLQPVASGKYFDKETLLEISYKIVMS